MHDYKIIITFDDKKSKSLEHISSINIVKSNKKIYIIISMLLKFYFITSLLVNTDFKIFL